MPLYNPQGGSAYITVDPFQLVNPPANTVRRAAFAASGSTFTLGWRAPVNVQLVALSCVIEQGNTAGADCDIGIGVNVSAAPVIGDLNTDLILTIPAGTGENGGDVQGNGMIVARGQRVSVLGSFPAGWSSTSLDLIVVPVFKILGDLP